jgi:hypothetical protein
MYYLRDWVRHTELADLRYLCMEAGNIAIRGNTALGLLSFLLLAMVTWCFVLFRFLLRGTRVSHVFHILLSNLVDFSGLWTRAR